jgi:hypothetical protein
MSSYQRPLATGRWPLLAIELSPTVFYRTVYFSIRYSSSNPDNALSLGLVGNGYTLGIGSWSAYKNFLLKGATKMTSNGADNPIAIEATKCGFVCAW